MEPKRRSELRTEDLRDFPAWITDNQATTLCLPWQKRGAAPLLSLVSVEFTAADGMRFMGFGTVTKLALVYPVLFVDDMQVPLHFGEMVPTQDDLHQVYTRLRSSASCLFPLTFEIQVPVKYKPVWNTLPAFTYKEPGGSMHEIP